MWQSVVDAFQDTMAEWEGVVPWMYLDIKGLVTVAIGNLIDPVGYAVSLPFVKQDGTVATPADILVEWNLIKSTTRLAKHGYQAAKPLTRLRLTPEGIDRVVAAKRQEMTGHLLKRFPELPTWPADAIMATLSMSWACGPGFRFPLLEKALKAKDFNAAALNCHINEDGNPGVAPRNVGNKLMYRNAAKVIALGLTPEVLHYPKVAEPEQPVIMPDFKIIHPWMYSEENPPPRPSGDE